MYPFILFNYRTAFQNKVGDAKAFHVIGFDVMLDIDGRPWLIEANANPSFSIEHEIY